MTLKEVLVQARELISDPERWTTGFVAVDHRGEPTSATHPHATAWCASGAIWHVVGDSRAENLGPWNALSEALGGSVDDHTIPVTNDGPDGHEKILAGFDKAIAKLEAKEAAKAPKILVAS